MEGESVVQVHHLPSEIYDLVFSFTTLKVQVKYETTCKELIELSKKRRNLLITNHTLPQLTHRAFALLLRHYPNFEQLEVRGYDEASGTKSGLMLAGALSKNTKLQQLILRSMNLKCSVMSGISKLLLEKTTNLKRFAIIENPITDAGAVYVAQALQNNNTITEVDLTDCEFAEKPSWLSPKTGTTELAGVLKKSSSITTLRLAGNMIGPKSIKELCEGLKVNKSLTFLDLNDNKIGDDGLFHLYEALKANSTLQTLLIGNNEITDKGAETLAEIIPITKVQCIGLVNNGIADEGCKILTNALRKPTRVTMLSFRGNPASADHITELYTVCPAGQTM
eukprot:TRINITY_DN19290_c0_g1_i1.p1 TRINITY_DN19290_c0_g1~~TRINITY_DN19290_c0_g1_i1.p1  ORF type:complete len:337 (+),score=88.15 TRINITY_DN19290_c0_g1_i1:26-1036(+)